MSHVRDRTTQAKIIRAVVAVGFIWAFIVLCWGLVKWERTGTPNFEMTGQFGDSFGFIGAMMAATAAYFAYRTYQAQSEETRLLRQERADAARLRAEPSFLNLLERRYDALEQFSFATSTPPRRGQDAIDAFARDVHESIILRDTVPQDAYDEWVWAVRNHSHLFRFTYHIVRYAERNFESGYEADRRITKNSLSYQYVRLLRSQMSDSELFLIGLNVLRPEGAGAKRLYERYALLHNLTGERMEIVRAAGEWDPRAFGFPDDEV
jgi:hypothetical protein